MIHVGKSSPGSQNDFFYLFQSTTVTNLFPSIKVFQFHIKMQQNPSNGKTLFFLCFLTLWPFFLNSRDSFVLFGPLVFMNPLVFRVPGLYFNIPQHWFLSFFQAKHLGYRENSNDELWIMKLWHTSPFTVGLLRGTLEFLRSKMLQQRLGVGSVIMAVNLNSDSGMLNILQAVKKKTQYSRTVTTKSVESIAYV